MKRLGLFCMSLLTLGAAAGCTKDASSEPPVSVDEAATLSALEQGEDGSDTNFQDPAAEAPEMQSACKLSSLRQHIKDTYDLNHDGTLDASEQAALNEDFGGPYRRLLRHNEMRRLRRHFLIRLYDENHDGTLDATEKAALDADLETRCENRVKQLLAHFDANHDGKLDASEWSAVRDDLVARFDARRAKLLAEFDHDHDGKLDLEERLDARQALRQAAEDERAKLEAEYDTDRDGKLNADERQALVDYLKARVRGEYFK